MGMFDSVWVRCPKCTEPLEFQSKGGECLLINYTVDDAPNDVLRGLVGDKIRCKCGKLVEIGTPPEERFQITIK